jgi:glycosyltransferase involved in cell wall biosynthesis
MIDPARLWVAYVDQVAQSRRLSAELQRLKQTRSWRVTAPLRWLLERARPATASRPALGSPGVAHSPALAGPQLPAWLPPGLQRPQGEASNLYVDVTQIALEDLGAGVQRVTRRVLQELMATPPSGINVVPVRLASDGNHYVASRFLEAAFGLAAGCLGPETLVQPSQKDAYLGLDFCREHTGALRKALARIRAVQAPVALVVHDLLPLEHPSWFPTEVSEDFAEWLRLLADCADVALCISDATRHALSGQLQAAGLAFEGESVTVPLGADSVLGLAAPGGPLRSLERRPLRVLMVGTVEPRKGHGEVLDAFDVLWGEGQQVHLVLAGRVGWQVEALVQRLRGHAQLGKSLHWIDELDDSGLDQLYASSDLLVMASHGEGYGLPVGEAAAAGCRLLLRDLPVFREVAGGRARFFGSTEGLLAALRECHSAGIEGWPDPGVPSWPTWAQSASACAEATRLAAKRREALS